MERPTFFGMITAVIITSCISAAFSSPIAQAASFDCSKANTRVEKLICEDKQISIFDDKMDSLYDIILNYLSSASEEIEADKIRAEQHKWLKEVRNICPDAACLRCAYEVRLAQLIDYRMFARIVAKMTSIYKTSLSILSKVDAERVHAEQNKWQTVSRCTDIECLRSAYEVRTAQLIKEAERDIRQYWETDGYWYFYIKNKKGSPPWTLAYFNSNGSDALLESGVHYIGNIWVNAQRFATQEELDLTTDMSSGTPSHVPQPLCNGKTVELMDNGSNVNFSNPITRVVIRTPQQADDYRCEDCLSFSIIRKQDPPKIFEKVLREDHQDPSVPLLIPLQSEIYKMQVLNDCTILAIIDEGVVRFRADGTTDAVLPSGMRLVDGKQIVRWENEFFQSFKGVPYMSLQAKLWFLYHKIFEGESQ